jgi:hypothetical protein
MEETTPARLWNFIEHPLFLFPIGIMCGAMGLLIYTPALLGSAACFVAAFHRAKVVAGKPLRVQVPCYITVAAMAVVLVFCTGWIIKKNVSLPTASDIATEVAKLITPQRGDTTNPHLHAVDVMLTLPQDKKQPIIVIGKPLNFSVIVKNDGAAGTLQFTSGSIASDHLISEASKQEAESFFYGMVTKGFDDPTIMKPVMDFDAGETESWMLTGSTGVTDQQFSYLNNGGILYFSGKGRYLGKPDLKPFELCFYWPHGLNSGAVKCETHNSP